MCTYVGLSSALWKNGGSDPHALWHHRSDRSRDEADSGVWGLVHGKGYFWARIWGVPLYPMGEFTAYVCDSASTVGAAVWGVACGEPRHCCIRWGSTSSKGKGRFWGGFVLHIHNGKCHCVADGKMFPIYMQKLHNISVRQTFRWKARFVGFFAIYSVSKSKLGFMRN